MKILNFYFDFISPYAFLAWQDLEKLADHHQVRLRTVPVLFAGLLNAHGQKGPAEIPAKRHYVFRDIVRLCHQRGLQLEGPPAHPFNPLAALRLVEAATTPHERLWMIQTLFDACWTRGLDISDKTVLKRLLEPLEFGGTAQLSAIENPAIKGQIRINTQEAILAGAFGVPTFVVDGEVFWGYDRMALLKDYLQGQLDVDLSLAERILNRPRSADRKQI